MCVCFIETDIRSRNLLSDGDQSDCVSMVSRDVSIGATYINAVAPKLSNTLTLYPPSQRLQQNFPNRYVPGEYISNIDQN